MNFPIRNLQSRVSGAKKAARVRSLRAQALSPTGPVRMEPLTFTIDGKPRGKGRPRFNPTSPTPYTPAETAGYERTIKAAGRVAMANHQPFNVPVSITVTAIFQQPKRKAKADYPVGRPDADNTLKLVMDALNKVVWIDDAYVVHAEVNKVYGCEPKTVVHVYPMQPVQLTSAPCTQGSLLASAPLSNPSSM